MSEEKNLNRLRIGQAIAAIRKEKGLSVRQLAELSGVTFQNINKIELGKYSVGIDVLTKITDALDCEVTITNKGG
jgi:transcriptional regulator with XRE-family HTH domain